MKRLENPRIISKNYNTTATFFDFIKNGQIFDNSLAVTSFLASVDCLSFGQQVINFPIQFSLRGLMILRRYEIRLL